MSRTERRGDGRWAGRAGPLVVVGDTLLDVDLEGRAERLAPDAPVPVVDVEREWQRPGGAGLAAVLAARSGVDVVLVTALGTDNAADRLRKLLAGQVGLTPLTLDGATSRKTRVLAGGVPVTRIDVGSGRAAEVALPPAASAALEGAGAILVADYGRGVASLPELRRQLTALAGRVPVVWDPHPRGSTPVPGCALITPNAVEAQRFAESVDGAEQGRRLIRRWRAEAVAVTVGRRGALLTQTEPLRFTPVPVPVPAEGRADTCGAGDAFAAAAATALLAGADPAAAVRTAVDQATAFVRAGAAAAVATPAPSSSVSRSLVVGPGRSEPAAGSLDPGFLAGLERVRAAGGRVVATGGCFDLLHRGHISLLTRARALGDVLVVCLNSDASVRRAKGDGRPIVAAEDRARVLSALACVDGVVIFDEPTPTTLLARLCPDVWVKGSDYADRPIPEAAVVAAAGGRVVLLDTVDGYSTTRLVSLSRRLAEPLSPTLTQEVS